MTRLLCVLCLLWASPVLAQTHPCDVVPPTNPTVASPVKFGWCMPQTEVPNVQQYKVYVDANPVPAFAGNIAPTGPPSPSGMVEVKMTIGVTVTQGPHSATVSEVNVVGAEGAKSVPYPFVVIGPPVVPTNLRIVP